MKVNIIIPARHASTRYPGKPLATIKGVSGTEKSLIFRTWEAASKVDPSFDVYIATDSEEIADHARSFGGAVIMTSSECRNGTERCWDAARQLSLADEQIVVNFQGDSLLTPPHYVNSIVTMLQENSQFSVCTPAVPCSIEHYEKLEADSQRGVIGGTFVVSDNVGSALYFSKRIIPFRTNYDPSQGMSQLHVGLYAYRMGALRSYASFSPSPLELLEGLEQLRFLDNAMKIGIALCDKPNWELWELNNPSDIPHIETGLSVAGLE